MGCWNETCGITQLPIKSGDPVVLVFIAHVGDRNRDHSGFCYINDQWSPKFLPIFGFYNDYGSVEDIQEDWNTKFIIERLREELVESRLSASKAQVPAPRGEPESNELDLETMTLEDVLGQIHDDRIWLPGVSGNIPLGWMMMHRWIWDHMTQNMERDWRDNLSLDQVMQGGRDYYTACQEHFKNEMSSTDEIKRLLMRHRTIAVDYNNPFYPLAERSERMDGYGLINGISAYKDLFWKHVESGLAVSNPQVNALIEHMARFLTFRANMSALRKHWAPQTGKGSQSENLEMHLALHKLAVEQIEATLARYCEEDGDWDDEEEAVD